MLENYNILDLIEKYKTPLYIINQDKIIEKCREINRLMAKYFSNYRIMYASKALNNTYILKLINSYGLGIDTVSEGELYTSIKAGINPNQIELHGNSKSYEEIEMAINYGIYSIIIDNFDELDLINKICKILKKKANVSIRLRPNIDVHTNKKIKTAILDCKFGFDLDEGIEAIKIIKNSKYLNFVGIHCHLGSQIMNSNPYKELIKVLIHFSIKVKEKLGITIKEFNCGGGFGVKYTENDKPIPLENFFKEMSKTLNDECNINNYPIPIITIEPGRMIVAEAGITIYKVNAIKEVKNIRNYCMVDGGMFENIRPMLYDSKYEYLCINKINEKKDTLYTIAGKCCETGDILAKDILLPKLNVGDSLVCLNTGAYGYSMASNYNRNTIPAMVCVGNNVEKLIIKRQTLDDLIRNDL